MAPGESFCRCPGCGTCKEFDKMEQIKILVMEMAYAHLNQVTAKLPKLQRQKLARLIRLMKD